MHLTPEQSPNVTWVANGADIDGERLVWAHDRGPENHELQEYFAGRTFWSLEDRANGIRLTPYKSAQQPGQPVALHEVVFDFFEQALSSGSFSAGSMSRSCSSSLRWSRSASPGLDCDMHIEVAAPAGIEVWNAQPLSRICAAGLCDPSGTFTCCRPSKVSRSTVPQRRLRDVDRHRAVQIVFVALENRVLFDLQDRRRDRRSGRR